MARTQKKSQKKSIQINTSRPFNFASMMNALENVGIKLTKVQKVKIQQEATRHSTRSKKAVSRYTPAKTVSNLPVTKRTPNKTKKITTTPMSNIKTSVPKKRVLRAKQLSHIMRSYEGKPEKANTYSHFKRLHDLYESKKNVYGFTDETEIDEIIRAFKEQDELAQSEVDELAKLFGSTGI